VKISATKKTIGIVSIAVLRASTPVVFKAVISMYT
jgi:hypothetical protein